MRAITVDFETHPIADRPAYPPEPVGVSIKWPGEPSDYYAWGHRTKNNCKLSDALDALQEVWDSGERVVFHHAKFDMAVATEKLGLPMLPWERIDDTMFLAYLVDPHARKIDLKFLAEEYLDWPPEERDEIAEWLWANRGELYREYGERVVGKHGKCTQPGKWLFAVPGDLCGRYACGDTDRTAELFEHFHAVVCENGMQRAYDRERELLPILMENERIGMRVDLELLRDDVEYYTDALEYVDDWLRERLNDPALSLDNDRQVAEAFDREGIVYPWDWAFTKTGNAWLKKFPATAPEDVPPEYRSVSKDNLPPEKYQDQQVAQAFGYRNRLSTCLKMFMRPWLAQAEQRDGWISTNWNQTRGGDGGTRTGRPSTSRPNLLNLSKDFENRSDGYEHPSFLDVEHLPLVRKYILADPGGVFCHRDYSGQEVRIFAHYEQGDLAAAYRADPRLDPHSWLAALIKQVVGKVLERTRVKNVTFSRLYGGGKGAVFQQARCADMTEAAELIAAHDKALPGRKLVVEEITRLVRRGEPIATWGGRLYFPEPPKRIDGRMRSFEYKLINYLVQGSAADWTKECLIRWYRDPRRHPEARFLVTVYDEINISAPEHCWQEQMQILRENMELDELDVPMTTEAKVGPGWGRLQPYADDWKEAA